MRRANDTRYGLSGSVWTKDLERGAEIAARLEVGTAWVNQHRTTSAFVPFGGAKESGPRPPIFGAGAEELHGARGRQRREAVVSVGARSPSIMSSRKSMTRSYGMIGGADARRQRSSCVPSGKPFGKRCRTAALNISTAAHAASADNEPYSSA